MASRLLRSGCSGRPSHPGRLCEHGCRRDGHRRGLGWAPRHPNMAPNLERQQRPVGVSDVDTLAVMDVDHRHPAAIDVRPVQRTVVDRQPPALIEPQQKMSTRNQRVRDAHVGPEVAPDNHVMARCEGAFRPVMPNGQRWWGWRSHWTNCSSEPHRSICNKCGMAGFDCPLRLASSMDGINSRHCCHRRRAGWTFARLTATDCEARIVTWCQAYPSQRSESGCRWSACTDCNACRPIARCAWRRRRRSG